MKGMVDCGARRGHGKHFARVGPLRSRRPPWLIRFRMSRNVSICPGLPLGNIEIGGAKPPLASFAPGGRVRGEREKMRFVLCSI
jgi:hypothetical protein